MNDVRITGCVARFDDGAYSRLQFLHAVSHSLGAHTVVLQPSTDGTSDRESDDRAISAPAASRSAASDGTASAPSPSVDTIQSEQCEFCLVAPREGYALVPCGHARFCESCARTVTEMHSGCPICRADIEIMIRVYN